MQCLRDKRRHASAAITDRATTAHDGVTHATLAHVNTSMCLFTPAMLVSA